jgi:Ran-binding protein 3
MENRRPIAKAKRVGASEPTVTPVQAPTNGTGSNGASSSEGAPKAVLAMPSFNFASNVFPTASTSNASSTDQTKPVFSALPMPKFNFTFGSAPKTEETSEKDAPASSKTEPTLLSAASIKPSAVSTSINLPGHNPLFGVSSQLGRASDSVRSDEPKSATAEGDSNKSEEKEGQKNKEEKANAPLFAVSTEKAMQLGATSNSKAAPIPASPNGNANHTDTDNDKDNEKAKAKVNEESKTESRENEGPEVPTVTGEENDLTLFATRAQLYVLVDGKYKERGVGTLKLNQTSAEEGKKQATNSDEQKDSPHELAAQYRLVMRMQFALHLILNVPFLPNLPFEKLQERSVRISSLDNNFFTVYLLRFPSADDASGFLQVLQTIKENSTKA